MRLRFRILRLRAVLRPGILKRCGKRIGSHTMQTKTTAKRRTAHAGKIRAAAPSVPGHSEIMSWIGSLARYAKGKRHSMTIVRGRIAEAMADGDLD